MQSQTKELSISSIGDLQLALIEDNNKAIKNYVERLDRETSNRAMSEAGVFFGFPTVEVEGVFRTSRNHLSRLFGYKKAHGLSQLLEKRGILGIKVGGFTRNVYSDINVTLGLEPTDHSTVLYDWPAFLIGGMNSNNDEARAVQGYLLKMERVARVGIVSVKRGKSIDHFPDSATGMVLAKLADKAYRGNPIACYVLENYYDVPANQLLNRLEIEHQPPDTSTVAGTIIQYLHALLEVDTMKWGVEKGVTPEGSNYLQGLPQSFFNAFVCIGKQQRLPRFFENIRSMGVILHREKEALEYLGWLRKKIKKVKGTNVYRYEYVKTDEVMH